MEKSKILEQVSLALEGVDSILAARAYGSWIYGNNSVDIDIAVTVPSNSGVVDSSVYAELKLFRENLVEKFAIDIDLIPHTEDEFSSKNSPIWYPRYNPSLFFGQILKGEFEVLPSPLHPTNFDFSDLTAYILHDNRTICRRQLVRNLEGESGRIFASKLLHGPGNVLTYAACKHKRIYICSPSDMMKAFDLFDELYGVDSTPAKSFLFGCKEKMDFSDAVKLMNWYESLLAIVLNEAERTLYQHICLEIS